MKIGIIGRSELTYNSMILAIEKGHKIVFIVTSKESSDYEYSSRDFKFFAEKNNIPFLYDPKITLKSLKNILDGSIPDICISVNYSGIIASDIINIFKYGILNAHGGDLPRYRGNACQAWALINGENKIGLCIHKMIGGELDSGDIISRSYMKININSRIQEIYKWMKNEIPLLFIDSINKISKNPNYFLEKQSKNKIDALRCYPRIPEDGKINWSNNSIDIIRLINASSEPYSGAFCNYDDKKIIIWRAKIIKTSEIYSAISGQISSLNKDGSVDVITGNGLIKISVIGFANKKYKPNEILNKFRVRLN